MDAMSNCPVADRRIPIRATQSGPHTVEITVSDAGVGIRRESWIGSSTRFTPRSRRIGAGIAHLPFHR